MLRKFVTDLNGATVWEALINELRAVAFRWDDWLATHPPVPGDHGELARVQRAASEGLADVVEAQAALIRQTELSTALQSQRTYLAGFPESDAASVLLAVQDAWNTEEYRSCVSRTSEIGGSAHTAYDIRSEFLAKLEHAAPAWALALLQRKKPHDAVEPPGDIAAAWRWHQWWQETRATRVSFDDGIAGRLEKTERILREIAAQIIEHETWAVQSERTGLKAKLALGGFIETMRKIGKGTGDRQRIAKLLREARELFASPAVQFPCGSCPWRACTKVLTLETPSSM